LLHKNWREGLRNFYHGNSPVYRGIKELYPRLSFLGLKVRALLVNSRPLTLLLPLVGGYCLIQASLTIPQIPTPDPVRTWVAILALALLNAWANNFNSLTDIEVDRINKPYRPLPRGILSFKEVAIFCVITLIMILILSILVGLVFYWLVVATCFLSMFYSGPLVRLKRFLWVNNATQATIRGVLGPLAVWSVYGSIYDLKVWGICIVLFTLILPLQTTKDFPDIEGDRIYGIKTLPVVYGVEKAQSITIGLIATPFIILGALTTLGILPESCIWLIVLYPVCQAALALNIESKWTENTVGWVLFYAAMILFLLGFALTI